jgi:hypothetical protein
MIITIQHGDDIIVFDAEKSYCVVTAHRHPHTKEFQQTFEPGTYRVFHNLLIDARAVVEGIEPQLDRLYDSHVKST